MAITHPSELGRAAFGSSVPSSSSSAPSGSNTQTQTLLNPNAPSSSSSPSSPAFPQPVIPEIVVDSADPPPPSYAETFPNGVPARPGPSPAPASTTSSRGSRRSGRSGRGRGNQSPLPNAPQNNQYPPQAVYVPPAARAAGAAAGMNERCSRGFHDYETHFGVIGIVMAILLFPFGIFCLFIDRKRKCRKCGFIWEN
ncbi:hypothetical protein DL93DRAFT_2087509 [Clavulina sp. PMI_390]|nr:hypothetical protein DL93DRAFT_2087509 [Clavulina sp. PMI_390]